MPHASLLPPGLCSKVFTPASEYVAACDAPSVDATVPLSLRAHAQRVPGVVDNGVRHRRVKCSCGFARSERCAWYGKARNLTGQHYEAPTLVRLGTVAELTEGGGGGKADAHGMDNPGHSS
jgi:hypothetical protein